MDRRHRSASRSRREDRRSRTSLHSSHESMAGNLSPGRFHPGHHSHSRRDASGGGGGGFFKALFGRRDKSPPPQMQQQQHMQQMQQQQMQQHSGGLPPPPPSNTSPSSKLRALLSFAPHHPGARQAPSLPSNVPVPSRVPEEPLNQGGKGLQHTIETVQDSYKNLETRLAAEQRAAQDWKEKCNYQNFKLNVMIDMLVLRILELEQPQGAPSR